MQILAFTTSRTKTFSKEQTEIRASDFVGAGVATVGSDDTTTCGVSFGEVFIFAIAAGPFVVPDVEDGTCLGWGFGFYG
jgi:hypothetical protein